MQGKRTDNCTVGIEVCFLRKIVHRTRETREYCLCYTLCYAITPRFLDG